MIPYIGGKASLSDFILPNCPKNPSKWIEPFGGMFGLFFDLNLKDYPNTEFIYNDINQLNCLLFDQLKSDDFTKLIGSMSVTKQVFENSYYKLDSKIGEEKALAWLIILCSGDQKDLMNKKYKSNSQFEVLKVKLKYYKDYFKRITVENLDYKDILKKYDSEDSFFYIDPPYSGFESYYINNTFKDNLELSKNINKLKGRWLLSCYKFDEMSDWYSGCRVISQKQGLGEEYLIIKP